MPVKPIPEGRRSITPYLIVRGVPELMEFLTTAFDAEEVHRTAMPDGSVVHAEVRIGDSDLMMGEAREPWKTMPGSIYVYVENVDETYQRALDAGAKSIMEPADQFYGDRHGGVEDPTGNHWWIATHVEDVSPEEMARREKEFVAGRSGG